MIVEMRRTLVLSQASHHLGMLTFTKFFSVLEDHGKLLFKEKAITITKFVWVLDDRKQYFMWCPWSTRATFIDLVLYPNKFGPQLFLSPDDPEEDAHSVLLKQRYRDRCQELKVGPARLVIHNIAGRSLCLAHHLLSSREIKALANPLTVSLALVFSTLYIKLSPFILFHLAWCRYMQMTVHLTRLDLSDTGLEDRGVRHLTRALLDNRSLETLVRLTNRLAAKSSATDNKKNINITQSCTCCTRLSPTDLNL